MVAVCVSKHDKFSLGAAAEIWDDIFIEGATIARNAIKTVEREVFPFNYSTHLTDLKIFELVSI
jgi:hypothetical protein